MEVNLDAKIQSGIQHIQIHNLHGITQVCLQHYFH